MKLLFAEHRLIHLFEGFGDTVKGYVGDVDDQYIRGPYRRRDPIQKGLGPVMAAGSVILEGPDQLWAGIVGQRLKPPVGIAGRIRRDMGHLIDDVVTIHPLRAVGDAFRLGFADVPLDAGDLVGGFRTSTRDYAQAALDKELSHPMSS